MPKNKNVIIRYKIINQMLLNGKSASKQAIADACYERLGKDVSLHSRANILYSKRYSEDLGYFAPMEYDQD